MMMEVHIEVTMRAMARVHVMVRVQIMVTDIAVGVVKHALYCQADLCQQLLPVLKAFHITFHTAVQAPLLLQLLNYQVSILHI